jgi:molybdenum cofactor synthesis domain-containing protein
VRELHWAAGLAAQNLKEGLNMKIVPVEKAVGQVLGQDLTKIVPGKYKGAPFRKGRIILEEDIPQLLEMGKHKIYVYELDKDELHENDAALALAEEIIGEGTVCGEAKTGRVDIFAGRNGLLKIDVEGLSGVNSIPEMVVATIHNNSVVAKGDLIGAAKIVPLTIKKTKIEEMKSLIEKNGPVIAVKTLNPLAIAIIVTGNEVYSGKVRDGFAPVIESKIKTYGCEVISTTYLPDDKQMITGAIKKARDAGAQLVVVTGGMAVDPDDVTPAAILAAGGRLVTYGSPVMPGAMFMLAYLDDLPIMGLPGSVMYYKTTIFDLVLPRLLAGERVEAWDITALGHGGLCYTCPDCTYPRCHFGKSR